MRKKILLRSMCTAFLMCFLLSLPLFFFGCSKSYNVNFNSNYENGETITATVEEGKTLSVKTPVREGYRFDDWYLEDYCKTKFDLSTKIDSDITLYAG